MCAILNRSTVSRLEIKTFKQTSLVPASPHKSGARIVWKNIEIPDDSGVYCLRLSKKYPGWKNIHAVGLHGPQNTGTISYRPEGYEKCLGWVYVGTSSAGIKTRFQRQLRPSNVLGHMILKAMKTFFNEANPIDAVLRYGTLYWTVLPGIENTVNRFFVESKLISELFPIFNVKSEH